MCAAIQVARAIMKTAGDQGHRPERNQQHTQSGIAAVERDPAEEEAAGQEHARGDQRRRDRADV